MTMTKYRPKTNSMHRDMVVGVCLKGVWGSESDGKSTVANDVLADLAHAEACLKDAYAEIERLKRLVDWHINHCEKDGGECMECSVQHCPHKEPLHFHHDGCPSCTLEEPDHAN